MTDPEALQELTRALEDNRPRLLSYIVRGFPRLADEAEDILHQVWLEARRRIEDDGFQPRTTWEAWLRTIVRSRAIDRLRVLERQVFLSWQVRGNGVSGDLPRPEPESPHPSPSREIAEQERRQRQGLLLSEVLAEFCRWCEKKSAKSGEAQRAALKEAYERSLRGQSPAEIAAAMGVSPNAVYQWLHQAREWVRQRITQKDIDRSVFLTLYGARDER
ncbi:RNA polymerase sigma factor [Thermopirellula anaerolimosa]